MKRGKLFKKHSATININLKVADADRLIANKCEFYRQAFPGLPAPELYRIIFLSGLEAMDKTADLLAEQKRKAEIINATPNLL